MGQIDLFGGADPAADRCRHHLAATAYAAAGPSKPTLSTLCADAQINAHPGLNPKSLAMTKPPRRNIHTNLTG